MERKYGDAFDFEIIAEGNFVDEEVNVTTRIIRLSCTALNDWIMSDILNCRDTYNTNEEWEAYKAKKAALRKDWERKILDKLNFTADTGHSITESVSEIFTVVFTEKILTT